MSQKAWYQINVPCLIKYLRTFLVEKKKISQKFVIAFEKMFFAWILIRTRDRDTKNFPGSGSVKNESGSATLVIEIPVLVNSFHVGPVPEWLEARERMNLSLNLFTTSWCDSVRYLKLSGYYAIPYLKLQMLKFYGTTIDSCTIISRQLWSLSLQIPLVNFHNWSLSPLIPVMVDPRHD